LAKAASRGPVRADPGWRVPRLNVRQPTDTVARGRKPRPYGDERSTIGGVWVAEYAHCCGAIFEGPGAYANGRFGVVSSGPRMSLQGRRGTARCANWPPDRWQPSWVAGQPPLMAAGARPVPFAY